MKTQYFTIFYFIDAEDGLWGHREAPWSITWEIYLVFLKLHPGKDDWPGYNFKIEVLYLGCRLLDVGYQVTPVLLLLQAGEDHLGAGDVLLGVLQIDVEGVLVPGDPLADVGRGVGEPGCSSSLPAPHTVKVGTWKMWLFTLSGRWD